MNFSYQSTDTLGNYQNSERIVKDKLQVLKRNVVRCCGYISYNFLAAFVTSKLVKYLLEGELYLLNCMSLKFSIDKIKDIGNLTYDYVFFDHFLHVTILICLKFALGFLLYCYLVPAGRNKLSTLDRSLICLAFSVALYGHFKLLEVQPYIIQEDGTQILKRLIVLMFFENSQKLSATYQIVQSKTVSEVLSSIITVESFILLTVLICNMMAVSENYLVQNLFMWLKVFVLYNLASCMEFNSDTYTSFLLYLMIRERLLYNLLSIVHLNSFVFKNSSSNTYLRYVRKLCDLDNYYCLLHMACIYLDFQYVNLLLVTLHIVAYCMINAKIHLEILLPLLSEIGIDAKVKDKLKNIDKFIQKQNHGFNEVVLLYQHYYLLTYALFFSSVESTCDAIWCYEINKDFCIYEQQTFLRYFIDILCSAKLKGKKIAYLIKLNVDKVFFINYLSLLTVKVINQSSANLALEGKIFMHLLMEKINFSSLNRYTTDKFGGEDFTYATPILVNFFNLHAGNIVPIFIFGIFMEILKFAVVFNYTTNSSFEEALPESGKLIPNNDKVLKVFFSRGKLTDHFFFIPLILSCHACSILVLISGFGLKENIDFTSSLWQILKFTLVGEFLISMLTFVVLKVLYSMYAVICKKLVDTFLLYFGLVLPVQSLSLSIILQRDFSLLRKAFSIEANHIPLRYIFLLTTPFLLNFMMVV